MRNDDTRVWATFLQWIKAEGAARGLTTVDAIAHAAGIDGATLGRWAESKNGPTLSKVADVADALGITVAELGAAFDHARNPDGSPEPSHPAPLNALEALRRAPDLTDIERAGAIQVVESLLVAMRGGPGSKVET